METLGQDIKYGARMLAKSPAFTLVAIVMLALAIGANTAIFSVVKAVLLDALPYKEPARLVTVAQSHPETPRPETLDFTTAWDWRQRSRSFEHLSLYRDWSMTHPSEQEPELLRGLRVSWDFFDVLGVQPQLGRTFRREEDIPNGPNVILLSDGLWRRRFGGDPNIVGKRTQLNSRVFQVIGVLPPWFRPLRIRMDAVAPELYAPLGYSLELPFACRGCQHLHAIGRLKPAISPEAAEAELTGILGDLIREHPRDYDSKATARVLALREDITGDARTPLWILFGAVGFVLLIACANLANLLLARATGRSREIALRAALGAQRNRLLRQLLTESLLLALIGGAAGVLLALWGTSLLVAIGPKEIPRLDEIQINLPVLAFTLAAALATGFLFGLAPSVRAVRVNLNDALKDAGRSTDTGSRHGLRSVLVASELALAFVLIVGAALLGKSFLRLLDVDPGFDARNVLTMGTYVWGDRYQKAEAELNLYRQAMERIRALPGVKSTAMVSTLPFTSFDRRGFHVQDRPLANPSEGPSVDFYNVTPSYFDAMKIPLKRGRLFTEADHRGTPPVGLLSESCARAQFPNEDPIGKQVQFGGRDEKQPWITVVGIVGDVRQYSLHEAPSMQAYTLQAQDNSFGYTIVVRTASDPLRFKRGVREAYWSVDKTQPVFNVQPLESYLSASLAQRRFTLTLLGIFGAIGLLMAGVGTYGVISYAVSQRTRELDIRMALGAKGGDALWLVMRQGLLLATCGLAVGYLASLALTQLIVGLLYEVSPIDLSASLGVAVLLAGVALVASYLPARRATKVDPMVALRYE